MSAYYEEIYLNNDPAFSGNDAGNLNLRESVAGTTCCYYDKNDIWQVDGSHNWQYTEESKTVTAYPTWLVQEGNLEWNGVDYLQIDVADTENSETIITNRYLKCQKCETVIELPKNVFEQKCGSRRF